MLRRNGIDREPVGWNREGMRRARIPWMVLVWVCLQTATAWACRYNVRDTGFVDFGTEPYKLCVFHRGSDSAERLTAIREVSSAVLNGSNIALELVNADEASGNPSLKHLSPEAARSLPAAVLVSPDGPRLPVALFTPGASSREELARVLRDLVTSPTREACLEGVCDAFAVVLLIEGRSQEANRQARQALTDSIEEIRNQMKLMPKAIARPPVSVVLETSALARERVLLWSLGLDTEATDFPRAAVLYGRARWIGPLMKGAEITARNLSGLLSIIGADCECGLDISWTQGTRLPVVWDQARHTRLAKALGFDPENPIVKLEVGRILGRRGSAPPAGMGYQEVSLDGALPTQAAMASTNPPGPSPGTTAADTHPRNAPEDPSATPIVKPTLIAIGGLAIVALAAGLFILFRSNK